MCPPVPVVPLRLVGRLLPLSPLSLVDPERPVGLERLLVPGVPACLHLFLVDPAVPLTGDVATQR